MKIRFESITKTYGDVIANNNVSFTIESGSIHAIIGENGAGKSTLVKMLAGQITPENGSIYVDDHVVTEYSSKFSINLGIGLLGQDPMDFSNLTVLESFAVGHRGYTKFGGMSGIRKELNDFNLRYGFDIDIDRVINQLSIGERQQLELMRLLSNGARVIVLDEPNSGLSLEQKETVFIALKSLTTEGYTVILVSHKLEDVIDHASSVSIMRSGKLIDTLEMPQQPETLIALMFGQQTEGYNPPLTFNSSGSIINIENVPNIDSSLMKLNSEEIVGVAGLQGSYVDNFMRDLFFEKENLFVLDGNVINKKLISYVPADRLEKGLFPDLNIIEHYALSLFRNTRILDWRDMNLVASKLITEYGIKGTPISLARELSGGNQQRLMLSMLSEDMDIVLLEQPTRGLDLASAEFIWDKLIACKTNRSLTMFSSYDVDEIYEYSDHILCFYGHDLLLSCKKRDITKDKLIHTMSGDAQNYD
jgi:simple sugar transport system ATP-binding protein